MSGGIPLWVWIVGGLVLIVGILVVLSIRGYPEDGSF